MPWVGFKTHSETHKTNAEFGCTDTRRKTEYRQVCQSSLGVGLMLVSSFARPWFCPCCWCFNVIVIAGGDDVTSL